MNQHETINYIELPVRDMAASKQFFTTVFNWEFTDYGAQYSAFTNAGIDGGFYFSELNAVTQNGSALVVFYSEDLEETQDKVKYAGGKLVKPIFEFPGGRRFHFTDPSGNEFAVWSDQAPR